MNILGSVIRDIRKSKGLTQKDLSVLTGFKQNTISNHENGNRQLDENDIKKYANALGISPQELFDRSGTSTNSHPQIAQNASDLRLTRLTDNYTKLDDKRRDRLVVASSELVKEQIEEQTDIADNIIPFRAEKLFDYEYYDQAASAGTGQYLGDVAKETIQLPIEVDADFVIPIHGDSMEPDYHEGDLIFVELTLNLADGDIGIFSLDGEVYIKQLLIKEGNKAYLHSLNSKYADIPITPQSDFRVIGEVVKSYREK